VTIQAQILRLIKDLQKNFGFTTIYITHDLGVVANVADRVAVMYAGQFVETGTAEEVFYDPGIRTPGASLLASAARHQGQASILDLGTPPSLFHEIKGDAFARAIRRPQGRLRAGSADVPSEPHPFRATWLLDPRAPPVEPPAAIKTMRARYFGERQ